MSSLDDRPVEHVQLITNTERYFIIELFNKVRLSKAKEDAEHWRCDITEP